MPCHVAHARHWLVARWSCQSSRAHTGQGQHPVVPGHWEGDLIKGAQSRSAVGTLVERTTLVHGARQGGQRQCRIGGEGLRPCAQSDCGAEASLDDLRSGQSNGGALATDSRDGREDVLCDPHSPWQRGINENTNGLLRQYLPKGSDLSVFLQEALDAIAWTLNTRPRKSRNFKCPAQLFTPDAFDFKQHHAALVALGA